MRGSKVATRHFGGSLANAGLAAVILLLTSLFAFAPRAQAQAAPARTEAPIKTGPAVGEKIPAFSAPDQNGKMQDFGSIRGPNGAVIVFNRSADW